MSQVALRKDQFQNLIQASYEEKEFRGEYSANNLIYAGFALPGADEGDRVWQIKKLAYTGSDLTSVKWPEIDSKASTDYSFSWTDRASYTYS